MTAEVATVPLALEDFLPVVLGGLGAYLLGRTAAERVPRVRGPAVAAAALVLLGGLCKAGWKLNLALTGDDVALIDDLLFAFLAPGFALLTWALIVARGRAVPLCAPLGIFATAGLTALAVEDTWPLLVVAVLGATATGVLGLLLARSAGDQFAMSLYGLQLALAYALVPFAGAGQSIATQWWEQSVNTVGQGAFAFAGLRLLLTPTTSRTADLTRSTR